MARDPDSHTVSHERAIGETFSVWYEREHSRMVATLTMATGDLELAVDSVDEAFARALARWERVGEMEAATGWAYRVALNHARRTARRRGVERILLRQTLPPPQFTDTAGELWELVAGLSDRQRQVIVLRHIADMKEIAIARALGISRSTVSSTLRDAHQRLGQMIEKTDGNASHASSLEEHRPKDKETTNGEHHTARTADN